MNDRTLEVAAPVIHLPGGGVHHVGAQRPEIPVELFHLDVDDGYAVPWVLRDGKTETAFRGRCRRAWIDGLCGACGFARDYRMRFTVCAPTEAEARATRDLVGYPMHDPCAAYMIAAYPPEGDDWWLVTTRKWKVRRAGDGTVYVRIDAPTAVERARAA